MHKPGFIREAFNHYLDGFEGEPEHNGQEMSVDWLIGQLWNSTDVLPADYCLHLGIPQGSTYAKAVQSLEPGPACPRCGMPVDECEGDDHDVWYLCGSCGKDYEPADVEWEYSLFA